MAAGQDKYFDSSEFKEKLERYEQAERSGQQAFFGSDDLSDIAEYYYNEGNKAKAVNILDYAITTFPGAALPLVLRARTALLEEKDLAAAKHYAGMVVDKLDLDYIYLEAELMISEKRVEEADAFLHDRMDKIEEDDLPDYVLDVAALYADYNLMDKAQLWLSLSNEPELADYKELKGRIAYSKGNYEESENIFEELLDDDPYSNKFWNSLASTQYMRDRINDSITSSEFSIAINPNDEEAILNKANGLFSLGNYEEALEYYKRFTEICPDEETGYMFQGNALLNMNRLKEAEELLKIAERKALKSKNNLSEIYQQLAFTMSLDGKLDEALAYIGKASELPGADRIDLLILKGHVLLDHNHVAKAQKCFVLAWTSSGHSQSVLLRIATSIFDCGYASIAYKMFKHVLGHGEDTANEGFSYMAYCCKQLERHDEFLHYLKKACELNPREAKLVLSELFPKGLSTDEYYDYALTHSM